MIGPYKLLLAALSVAASISVGIIGSESASAHPYNQAEVNAYYRCTNTVGGAIWVNNGNYYDGSVQVNSSENYVGVAIRGSAYNCGGRAGDIYAVNVSSTDQWRLGGLSSSVLYRGYVGNPPSWSTQGGDIYATLNISDVPQNNTTSAQSHYRTIGIYRCFSRTGNTVTGSCDTEIVGIYITRAGRPITWNINGQTYIGNGRIQDSQRRSDANYRPSPGGAQTIISSTPGQTVHWNHLMRNNGPDATNRNLQVSVDQLSFDVGTFNGRSGNSGFSLPAWQNSPASPNQLIYEGYQDQSLNRYNRTITQDDVGRRICQRVAWNPGSSSNGGWSWAAGGNGSWETGGYDCVDVPYNYTIYPQILSGSSSFLTEGSTAIMDPRVQNGGETKANGNIESAVYEFVIPGGEDIDFSNKFNSATTNKDPEGTPRYYQGTDLQAACGVINTTYAGKVKDCKALDGNGGGAIAVTGGKGSTYGNATSTLNSSDYSPGDRVCRFLVIRNISNTETNSTKRRASIPTCFSIGKKPKVQVHGGNLSVGKMFEGTTRPSSSNSKVQTSVIENNRVIVQPSDSDLAAAARATGRYWAFGNKALLDFGTNTSTQKPIARSTTQKLNGQEGTTTITDKKGNLLFYTDGLEVRSASGAVIRNGSGLMGSGTTTQAAAAFPLSNDRFMVVTSSAQAENNLRGELRYSIIDRTQNNGAGAVTMKNAVLGTRSDRYIGEAISVAPNANSDGYWVVTNETGTNRVLSFAVSYDGTINQNPVVSAMGAPSGGGAGQTPGFGTINFNADYSKAVLAMGFTNNVRIFNFDKANGALNQTATWSVEGAAYSADFSPSGEYVYYSALYTPPSGQHGVLYRFKLDGSGKEEIWRVRLLAGQPAGASGGGQVKRGPDGRMYVADYGRNTIGVVNNPDAVTIAQIGRQPYGVTLASGTTSGFGLPQTVAIVRAYLNDPPTYATKTYGSWAEYGIFAPNIVDGTASAAGLNVAGGASSNKQADWSRLTYGNNGEKCASTTQSFGCYTHGDMTLPDPSKRYPLTSATTLGQNSVSVDDLQGVYKPRATGLTISGGTVKKGQWVVINAQDADVHITGDLKYQADDIGSINDLPQLIIIARNITIADNVTEINAWLVAKPTGATGGVINTCTTAGNATNTSNLSITDCPQRLTVNGPVVSDRLILRRTAGSENAEQQGEPAEIFNLRPDAYLWAYSQAGTKTNLRTTAIRDLPPRW